MDEVGEILLRTFDFADRSFRRKRWGTRIGNDGQETGTFVAAKMRAASSRRGRYWEAFMMARWRMHRPRAEEMRR